MIFADTNVLIDVADPSSEWRTWSRAQLAAAKADDVLVSDTIVMAELAGGFSSVDALLDLFGRLGLKLLAPSPAAAFRAGKAQAAYRRAGGRREAILADFLVGGHAATLGATLLTRDRRRFAGYFPELELITPDIENG